MVVYFPGNSINRYERLADLKEVAACGIDVLIFDYRGFGDSTGSPTEDGMTADARLIWTHRDPKKVVPSVTSLNAAFYRTWSSRPDGGLVSTTEFHCAVRLYGEP